jgi:hypothetical protein
MKKYQIYLYLFRIPIEYYISEFSITKMKPINKILYHGTCLSHIPNGFQIQDEPFGESFRPFSFIFLATNFAGAENAAFHSRRKANERIQEGDLSPTAFTTKNCDFPPRAYVYEVKIHNARVFDWGDNSPEIEINEIERIIQVLMFYHKSDGIRGQLEFYKRRIMFLNKHLQLKDWIKFVIVKYNEANSINSKTMPIPIWPETLVDFFKAADYDLVKNIERDGDGQNYGEVWALILPPTRPKTHTILSRHDVGQYIL